MSIQLGVLMDPIETLSYKKDSTIAMLWEAAERGWEIHYFQQKDIFLRDGKVFAHTAILSVKKPPNEWYKIGKQQTISLGSLSLILMRKDPPFDMEYIYTTYLLEQAEREGTQVVNKPSSLRDANEKIFTSWFPQCCPATLVTRSMSHLKAFLAEKKDIVCKPLDGMGGASIFRLSYPDLNASVIYEVLTQHGSRYIMAQSYIPEIEHGDKRILLINGEPIPYALARIPAQGELRGNLAAGGTGLAMPLTERDYWICKQVGPLLREKGLLFVGLDVIGDYLTEINVTSPTCIRELDEQCQLNISQIFFDCLAASIKK